VQIVDVRKSLLTWGCTDGFLISQFLSVTGNTRTDEFGGTPARRTEFLLRIIRAVRNELAAPLCVGVKINTADYMNDPQGYDDLIQQLRLISAAGVDYVQLSGGSFEDPQVRNHFAAATPVRYNRASPCIC
jgi:2,4-dienoyl-CoA reductase-like NADH-dependent reductase (Old Yellow Enzyme family)